MFANNKPIVAYDSESRIKFSFLEKSSISNFKSYYDVIKSLLNTCAYI